MTVKCIACSMMIGLFVFILAACAESTPEVVEEMINQGDEIGGMVFTTIDPEIYNMYISLNAFCGWDPKEIIGTTYNFECAASPGDSFHFGTCIAAAAYTIEDLDDEWNNIEKIEMTFDGQGVNFLSFGSLDFTNWDGRVARGWNVMVENITPGNHTLQCRREFEDVTYENNWRITVPSDIGTYPTLSAEVIPGLHPFTSEKSKLNYFLYIPDEYGVDLGEKWPLILSLHGLEEGAMNSMEVLGNIMLKHPQNLDHSSFIMVSPQGTTEYADYEIWASDEVISALITLLDEIQATIAVDSDRIYLTGESAGGNGTWAVGLRHPDRFAALVPVIGYYGWPFEVPENICDLKDVPVWAFHGADDETVPLDAEQMLVDALKACGGDVQFTVYPDIGHELDMQIVYTTELYEWLLAQTSK